MQSAEHSCVSEECDAYVRCAFCTLKENFITFHSRHDGSSVAAAAAARMPCFTFALALTIRRINCELRHPELTVP